MDLEKFALSLPEDIRALPAIKGVLVLVQTLAEQLQATQEKLLKAEAKIQTLEDELRRLRKTPKRPKFRPNNMEPRNRTKSKGSDSTPPSPGGSSTPKKTMEIKVAAKDVPINSRFKG